MKIGLASGTIFRYVGGTVYVGGTLEQRERAREYFGWILQQVGSGAKGSWNGFNVFDAKMTFMKTEIKKTGEFDENGIEKTEKKEVECFEASAWIKKHVPDLDKLVEESAGGRSDLTTVFIPEDVDGRSHLGIGRELRDLDAGMCTFSMFRGGPEKMKKETFHEKQKEMTSAERRALRKGDFMVDEGMNVKKREMLIFGQTEAERSFTRSMTARWMKDKKIDLGRF